MLGISNKSNTVEEMEPPPAHLPPKSPVHANGKKRPIRGKWPSPTSSKSKSAQRDACVNVRAQMGAAKIPFCVQMYTTATAAVTAFECCHEMKFRREQECEIVGRGWVLQTAALSPR